MFVLALLLFAASLGFGQQRIYLVHDEVEPMLTLAHFLEEKGNQTFIENQETFALHMRSIAPAAIFMYVHGAFDEAVEQHLIEYAEGGGRLVILHHGIASGKMKSNRWMPFVGVKIFPRDHGEHPWKVLRGKFQLVNLIPGHYVTSKNVNYPKNGGWNAARRRTSSAASICRNGSCHPLGEMRSS